MRWLVVSAVGAFSLGCGGFGTPDGGSGGGGGGSGGGSTGGGSGGGGTLGGTLVGLAAVPVNAVSAQSRSPDGGFDFGALHVYFHDRPAGTNVCTSLAAPARVLEVSLGTGSSAISPGTYDMATMIGGATRYDLTASGTFVMHGYGLVGTITVTHLDATSSAGSFSTTMSMVDGGSSALSGSWDTVNCP